MRALDVKPDPAYLKLAGEPNLPSNERSSPTAHDV